MRTKKGFMNFLTLSLARSKMQRLRVPAVLMLALLTPVALAQQAAHAPVTSAVATHFPAEAINSVEVADQALAEATAERAGIETQFASDERACYSKFLATSCLESAKERRRRALRLVHRVEVDANTFKRRQRVVERDHELEERRASDAAKAPPPTNPPQDPAQPASNPAAQNAASAATDAHVAKARNSAARAPRAPHVVQPKAPKAEPAADAHKRADNVAAYNKKVAESEARQREVAEKKAEKERERAAKEKAAPKP